jgi:hypothetical protein
MIIYASIFMTENSKCELNWINFIVQLVEHMCMTDTIVFALCNYKCIHCLCKKNAFITTNEGLLELSPCSSWCTFFLVVID